MRVGRWENPSVALGELIDRLKVGFRRADALWTERAAKTAPGEMACRGGCFGCCVGLFEISLAEALVVRAGLERLPEEARRVVRARAERIVERTRADFPGDPGPGLLDPERTEEADDRYFATVADSACPMLELPSGSCRIYEERPITCRTFGLPWTRSRTLVHPACPLNFVGSSAARQREVGIDLDLITEGDQELAELALSAGLPSGAETTVAHAITGSVFAGIEDLAGVAARDAVDAVEPTAGG